MRGAVSLEIVADCAGGTAGGAAGNARLEVAFEVVVSVVLLQLSFTLGAVFKCSFQRLLHCLGLRVYPRAFAIWFHIQYGPKGVP